MRYESFYPFRNQAQMPPRSPMPNYRPPMGSGNPPFPRDPRSGGGFAPPPFPGSPQSPGQSMPNSSKIDQYMQTANRFMNTAQQFAPLVQQFAPMVQNLPAMWKLYKGFQALPNADSNPSSAQASINSRPQTSVTPTNSAVERASTPRIFQPPL